jgi:hypothetical protein
VATVDGDKLAIGCVLRQAGLVPGTKRPEKNEPRGLRVDRAGI